MIYHTVFLNYCVVKFAFSIKNGVALTTKSSLNMQQSDINVASSTSYCRGHGVKLDEQHWRDAVMR